MPLSLAQWRCSNCSGPRRVWRPFPGDSALVDDALADVVEAADVDDEVEELDVAEAVDVDDAAVVVFEG